MKKFEQEIKKKYGGRIKAAYGCSLGGSFVSLLIQRRNIHIDHGIIGSSDMDEAGHLMAKIPIIDRCADYASNDTYREIAKVHAKEDKNDG